MLVERAQVNGSGNGTDHAIEEAVRHASR
jgi:hypothetical protein